MLSIVVALDCGEGELGRQGAGRGLRTAVNTCALATDGELDDDLGLIGGHEEQIGPGLRKRSLEGKAIRFVGRIDGDGRNPAKGTDPATVGNENRPR